jgi:hypothetical protein
MTRSKPWTVSKVFTAQVGAQRQADLPIATDRVGNPTSQVPIRSSAINASCTLTKNTPRSVRAILPKDGGRMVVRRRGPL